VSCCLVEPLYPDVVLELSPRRGRPVWQRNEHAHPGLAGEACMTRVTRKSVAEGERAKERNGDGHWSRASSVGQGEPWEGKSKAQGERMWNERPMPAEDAQQADEEAGSEDCSLTPRAGRIPCTVRSRPKPRMRLTRHLASGFASPVERSGGRRSRGGCRPVGASAGTGGLH
jgi:hypothetical protein